MFHKASSAIEHSRRTLFFLKLIIINRNLAVIWRVLEIETKIACCSPRQFKLPIYVCYKTTGTAHNKTVGMYGLGMNKCHKIHICHIYIYKFISTTPNLMTNYRLQQNFKREATYWVPANITRTTSRKADTKRPWPQFNRVLVEKNGWQQHPWQVCNYG